MKNKNYKSQTSSWLTKTFLALMLWVGLLGNSYGQVSYSNNFNVNATGWTGNITRTTATTACGSASMRRNLYSSATTGNMVSPLLGTSNGALVTLSYNYKVANWSANTVGTPNPWGSFNVQYGATASGPWTTFQTIDQTNHVVSGTCSLVTVTFTPPAGALYIKWDAFWSAGDYYINFDDVTVSQAAGSPCSGTPAPGNTVSSAANVCSGSSFNLSLQNLTSGSGVSYQWQSSPDGSSWTNFGTDAPTQSVSQTSATYYQCIVTCSGNSGTSTPVIVGMNSLLGCYCAASYSSSCSGDGITNVVLNTLSNPSTGCPGSGNYTYVNPGVAGTSLYKGQSYTLSVTVQSDPNQWTIAWIDYNNDGVLDASEALGAAVNPGANGTANIAFTVPVTATTAITRLRIRGGVDAAPTTAQACGANMGSTWGEVEDYDIQLMNEPPCIDPPTAGTALSTVSQFCNSGFVSPVLSLNGNSIGAGQTYQWQESEDGVNWTDIIGATGTSYTYNGLAVSKYFQCNVTCGASTVASTTVFVEAVDPPVAGTISGPASVYANQAATYSSVGENGSLQWQARLLPSGTFANVSGATNNPQNIFYSSVGSYEIQLVTSVPGCANAISNIVTTVVTIQNDNVCDAIPVNIGLNGPFTNVGATTEPGEPVPPGTGCNGNGSWCNSTLTNSVWFTFTVPTGGSGRYGFAAPAWDSQIAIYKAASCGDILTGGSILWAANDDSLGSPYNAYARGFCLEEGETVYIQVDGYSGTNGAFAVRIDDFGPAADASFSGLPATACANGAAISLSAVTAGGTFSGSGVSGNSFDPAVAGAGFHTVTYSLSGLDTCVSTSQVIEVITPSFTYYADADGDSYGDNESSILSCDAVAPSGYSADNTDCDDANIAINPAATEVCNNIDDNCDANVDEGFDVDNDGYTSCNGDCDDNNSSVYPGAAEVCNGIDDDCNLLIDDGLTFITYYADVDGDTYGDAGNTVSTCDGAPSGYVSDNTDCNDNNGSVNPAGTEVCNTIDDDCDGLIDENLLVAGPISGPAVQCVAVVTGSATFSIAPVADASAYTWTVPAGMTILSGQGSNSIFVSWTPSAAHTGIIGNMTVTPNNACGAGTASSVLIDINYTKPVMPNSISGPVKVCPGDVAVYSTNLIARASYFVWSVPAGMTITSGASSNVITVSVGAGYVGGTVSVSAANGCGVGPARLRAVAVNTPGVSASISGQASGVCGASGVSYTAAAVVGATSYNWTVPAGATIISGQGSSSISVDFTGSYGGGSISVVASNACGSGSARSLTVSGAPGQPGIISGDQSICPGQSNVPYSVSTVAGASTYTWSVPSIASIASGQGTKDIYVNWGTNPTTGQQVTVYASNGCGNGPVRILNGIAIDLGNCVRIGETGAATGLNIFPNPATEMATILFNGTEGADFNLTMVDVAGRVVMTERGTAVDGQNQRNVVVSEMASGVYFLTIQINGASEQIRVMVD